jgi:hypothetical protein
MPLRGCTRLVRIDAAPSAPSAHGRLRRGSITHLLCAHAHWRRMEHRPQGAVARPEQEQETAGRNRASTVDLLNSPVMILQPESEKDLDSLSRAFEVSPVAL